MSAPTVTELIAERLRSAEGVLTELGHAGTRVEALGDVGEIAVLNPGERELPPEQIEVLVGALRSLGFRHVTLDLG